MSLLYRIILRINGMILARIAAFALAAIVCVGCDGTANPAAPAANVSDLRELHHSVEEWSRETAFRKVFASDNLRMVDPHGAAMADVVSRLGTAVRSDDMSAVRRQVKEVIAARREDEAWKTLSSELQALQKRKKEMEERFDDSFRTSGLARVREMEEREKESDEVESEAAKFDAKMKPYVYALRQINAFQSLYGRQHQFPYISIRVGSQHVPFSAEYLAGSLLKEDLQRTDQALKQLAAIALPGGK